ncbi:MAG: hypothetical protein FWB98_07075 [Defluviitaleaceae bacterium]|nr:hypothetical protein [Defluviitaleaceae bacterium]
MKKRILLCVVMASVLMLISCGGDGDNVAFQELRNVQTGDSVRLGDNLAAFETMFGTATFTGYGTWTDWHDRMMPPRNYTFLEDSVAVFFTEDDDSWIAWYIDFRASPEDVDAGRFATQDFAVGDPVDYLVMIEGFSALQFKEEGGSVRLLDGYGNISESRGILLARGSYQQFAFVEDDVAVRIVLMKGTH